MAKILAIDDNKDNLTVLSALLAEAFPEIEFLSAFSGRKGIELCLSEKPDVILLDIVMPAMDGFEVCQILKADEATKNIPIIIITAARTDKESRIKALECGADSFLTKPVDETELTAQIKAMLRIKEAEDRKLNEKERLEALVIERTRQLELELEERNKVEKALYESEEKYRGMVELMPDAVIIHEAGKIVFANKASLIAVGAESINQMAERSLIDYVHPDFRAMALERINKIYASGQASEFSEEKFITLKNEILHVEVIGLPIVYMGRPAIQTILRDITKRKLAEEVIKANETQFREFFLKAADAIFIAEVETGFIVDVNEAASRMMQVPREQIIGLHQSQIHPKPKAEFSIQTFKDHDQLAKQKLPMLPSENEVIRPDGSLVPVEVMASEVIYQNKKCLMGTFRNITERKQADMRLRESEYLFKESQRAAFVGSYKFDIMADKWTSSEVLDQIFGIDHTFNRNLQGWLEIAHPEDLEMMRRYFLEEVIANQQPFNKEYRIISHLDGELRWVLGLGKLNLDAEGKVIEMIGTIQDITERKRLELARKETYEFNQSLLKTIPFGMDIVDEEGNILFQSANLENVFTSKAMGCKCWDLYRDNKTQCNSCPLNDGIKLGKTSTNESSDILGGRVFEISHTGMMFKGKKAILEIFQDITERKLAEEKLRESQELFQELFNASPDAIVLIDPQHPAISWPIVDCNEAACHMNGYTREELIGQSIDILNITAGTTVERTSYLDSVRKEGAIHAEVYHIHKDGHIFPVEVSTTLVTIGGKEMVFGIDRDISERKKAEKELAIQKQRLTDILRGTNAGTWTWNVQTGEVILNDRWTEIIGYTLDELKPISISTWINTVYPDDLPAANEMLNKHFNGELEYFDVEFRQPHKDGKLIWVNSRGKVIEWTDDGKPLWMSGTHLDITERKLAEKNLHESEDRYRSFISQISEGVYRFECDEPMDINLPIEEQVDFIYDHMYIEECNKAFLEMYGITDEKDVIGKTHLDFHGGRNNLLNRGALRDFVRNGFRIENAMTEEINHLGQVVYFSNNSLGIIENNQLVRMWGTQADISDKKRADQIQQVLYTISNAAFSSQDLHDLIKIISEELSKLLDSTNFFIAFYDEKTDMLSTIYETDEKDEISSWAAGKSITGYVIKQKKSLLVNESEVMKLCDSGEIEMFGTPSKIWLGVPLFTENKVAGALVVQSYDNPNAYTEKDLQILEFISHQISVSIERKKTDQDLKLMGKAFDQSPVTIAITDRDGNIEYVNPKFSETTGYTLDEVKGKNPRILQSGDHSKEYYKNLWETILSGNDWIGEFHNKRKNGESYWESAVISPITNERGEIAFFLAIKEDITEKKKMIEDLIDARKAAEESDRLKSAFLANMSHEIRTPLNAIIGFSELIRDPAFEPEQQDEFAQLINDSGNNLLSILSDIMDISKIEAGQVTISKRRISVNKLITSIQKEFARKADRKGIELRLILANPDEAIEIETDDTKIRQIIVNFLSNALKFTETGYIELGIEAGANSVKLYVKDTGIGIPEVYHEKVFERFRQVETSHTRKYGGNGLGLCISKNLIELLGGTIGMESQEGKGSTFNITIPRN
jgi:PAS domain S-box-containing protein